jgi:acetyl-CoA C-acetyltransferase
MNADLTPILVGAGQVIEKGVDPAEAMGPVELMAEAARRAADDAGIGKEKLAGLDFLVAVKSVLDVLTVNGIPNPIQNPPEALAERLGAHQARQYISPTGGNTPQMLVNQTAQGIADGQIRFALFAGAEALDTMARSLQVGLKRDWTIHSSRAPELLCPERDGTNEMEKAHGLYLPTHTYPLFENALRNYYGRTIEDHQAKLGQLFSRFTEVAANNPYAWFPVQRRAEEIAISSPNNRYVAFPYTKRMTAMIKVNQSAALIMTSVDFARQMGIDASRWIFLNGCGDANDHWYVTERVNYCASPAIATAGQKALAMAGVSIDEIDFLDLYSCFPSAVQISRDMLGINENDPRHLTVTGGLPYHGGPGNNYSMHAIAAMVDKLRNNRGKKGLVTANGWYITKHSLGIYGTEPNIRPWCREAPSAYQPAIDAQPHPEVVNPPAGTGTVETYTVIYDRNNEPNQGIIIGRLQNGRRFIANTPQDRTLLENFTTRDAIGISGQVHQQKNLNIFSPA